MDKIGVLFVVPSLKRAGAETQVVDLVNGIDFKSIDKYLFTYLNELDQYDRLDLQSTVFYHRERRNKFDFGVIRSIAEIIEKDKIDVIHCTLQNSLLMAFIARLISPRKPKVVCAIHTTISESRKGELFDRYLYVQLLRYCDRIIFVSYKQAAYWKSKYPCLAGKYDVIHNGVNVDYFDRRAFHGSGKSLKERLCIPPEAKVLSCTAGFRREKGHEVLIEAFSHLGDEVYLLLAGDGERKRYIEALTRQKGLEHRVKFLGQVQDVRPVFAASEVSVLPSSSETFSMAMLESLSMEVPVVASNVGGLSEAIQPGETGELVPPNDPIMLSEALKKVLDDTHTLELMRSKCRQLIKSKFTFDKMAATTENLLIQVSACNLR